MTDRDGACGVPVWVVCPAHVIPLVPGSQVRDHQTHSASVLIIPGLGPGPGLQRVTSPCPLDRGGGNTRDLTLKHGLAALLHPQTLERAHPLGRPPGDPEYIRQYLTIFIHNVEKKVQPPHQLFIIPILLKQFSEKTTEIRTSL